MYIQAFGAHEDGGHAHDQTTIWRGVCVLAGILLFYMFEVILGIVKRKLVRLICYTIYV